ncbi:hypothetical protein B0H10DRAFT_2436796 [Mycena sp. CBHHK59/15]|nr:hypothetical protein B0H10DRAFT_2436796 [Mycena sp. CBHHK59/15]
MPSPPCPLNPRRPSSRRPTRTAVAARAAAASYARRTPPSRLPMRTAGAARAVAVSLLEALVRITLLRSITRLAYRSFAALVVEVLSAESCWIAWDLSTSY